MNPGNTPSIAAARITAPPSANFDRIARPYRWMEYLTFGSALWRRRTHFLPRLQNCRNALILGDGDGRFTAAVLAANPQIHVDAVDSSAAMLHLLKLRASTVAPDASTRLRIHNADALAFAQSLPSGARYDLVVTHFFLDCLTRSEVESLAHSLAPHLCPDAQWIISDFRIPTGFMRWPARILVRSLYLVFHALTGLRTTRLPDHTAALRAAGFTQKAQHLSCFRILTSERWTYTPQADRRRLHTMQQLPPQRPRTDEVPDPVPDPDPPSPSLPTPDSGVFRPDPQSQRRSPVL